MTPLKSATSAGLSFVMPNRHLGGVYGSLEVEQAGGIMQMKYLWGHWVDSTYQKGGPLGRPSAVLFDASP